MDEQQLLINFKKYLKLTLMVFLGAVVLGLVGGFYVYDAAEPGTTISGFELLLPTLIVTVLAVIYLKTMKKKYFADKQQFETAKDLFTNQKK